MRTPWGIVLVGPHAGRINEYVLELISSDCGLHEAANLLRKEAGGSLRTLRAVREFIATPGLPKALPLRLAPSEVWAVKALSLAAGDRVQELTEDEARNLQRERDLLRMTEEEAFSTLCERVPQLLTLDIPPVGTGPRSEIDFKKEIYELIDSLVGRNAVTDDPVIASPTAYEIAMAHFVVEGLPPA